MEYAPVSVRPLGLPLPRTGERTPPRLLHALQAYLDVLPIAAGVLAMEDGAQRLVARNTLLSRIEARAGRTFARDMAGRVAAQFRPGAVPDSFAWEEPGVGARHFQVHLAPLKPHPQLGPRVMVNLIDCTTAIETERWLRFGMLHDGLTGLPNRQAFADAIDALIERGNAAGVGEGGGTFAILKIDLTRFSRINEGMGALAGDELILTVASRLKSALTQDELLARMAADEFAILVPLTDGPGDALHVARRVQGALASPLRLSDLEIKVDCAIGCALWQEAGQTSADIIRNGQFALKRAKRSGRIEIYQPGEAGRARRRFTLETELRRAIEADALDLAFQPLVDLETSRVTGFEVLTRWTHPDHGMVSPVEFISVAEESGLILPLGRSVIDRAVRTLAAWDKAAGGPLPIYLGVNVSPVQLARDPVPAIVADALDRHGIGGERLTLELTESSIVADPTVACGVLDALKRLSCRIAIDDFGTGYSSLAYLQRLPIDVLKIDRQFVSAMFDDRDSTAIIRAILSLSSALGMKTIAEGVETQAAAHTLAALGCGTGQGYLFGKPMAADDALAFLSRQRQPG